MKINNKLIQKDIITIKLKSDYTIKTTSAVEKVTGFQMYDKVGDKLDFSNNNVIIGSGIKKVKVSYNAKIISTKSTTREFTYLTKNSDNTTQEGAFFSATNQQITNTISPIVYSVNEGDTFGLAIYGEAGNQLSCYLLSTALTVEVVEYE
jgi:hypothetical protein